MLAGEYLLDQEPLVGVLRAHMRGAMSERRLKQSDSRPMHSGGDHHGQLDKHQVHLILMVNVFFFFLRMQTAGTDMRSSPET